MSRSLFSAVVLAWLVACSLGAATGGAQESRKPPQFVSAELRIREALDDTAVFEFIETPMADVVEVLKDAHQIPIAIDIKALDDVGLSTDVPITRMLKGVTLRSGLLTLLRELNLTYAIENESLVITTVQAAVARPASRVFSVADLLPGDAENAEPLAELIRETTSRPEGEADAGPRITTYGTLLVARGTEEDLDAVATLLWRIENASVGEQDQPEAVSDRPGRGRAAPSADPFDGGVPAGDPFAPAAPQK